MKWWHRYVLRHTIGSTSTCGKSPYYMLGCGPFYPITVDYRCSCGKGWITVL